MNQMVHPWNFESTPRSSARLDRDTTCWTATTFLLSECVAMRVGDDMAAIVAPGRCVCCWMLCSGPRFFHIGSSRSPGPRVRFQWCMHSHTHTHTYKRVVAKAQVRDPAACVGFSGEL